MIKVRSYDLQSILLLTILKIFSLISMLMIYLSEKDDGEIPIIQIAIVLGFIGLLSVSQILVYLLTLTKLLINDFGITIYGKSNKKSISWYEIKLFSYYSEIFILEPNTLTVKYGNNKILLGKYSSNIYISLKKYKRAIKFIPKEIIEKNKLFLYETTYLYERDKYKLY